MPYKNYLPTIISTRNELNLKLKKTTVMVQKATSKNYK